MNHSSVPSGQDPSSTFTLLCKFVCEALVITSSPLSLAPRSRLAPEVFSTAARAVFFFQRRAV